MDTREILQKAIEAKKDMAIELNDQIWALAELPRREKKSAALLCEALRAEGFAVEENVCGCATAFVAKFGEGKPVIGLLGEYDALPNLSQKAGCAEKIPVTEGAPGHGCGHSEIGTGSLLAALAVKAYLEEKKCSGTVVYYGCAGEEGKGVKPFMARDGYFADTDCVFGWHPSYFTGVTNFRHYAIKNFEIEFHGKSAHAGAAPHLGRSALDACELTNVGCNYLREHIPQDTRLHYAYVNAGGPANNIVQDHCVLSYGVRALTLQTVDEVMERVKNVARGAALMTDTQVSFRPTMGYSDFFQNSVIAGICDEAMTEVGGPAWDGQDFALARKMTETFDATVKKSFDSYVKKHYPREQWEEKEKDPLDTQVRHFRLDEPVEINSGSTDVGDVGYVTPTSYLFVSTFPIGAPGHSWYMTSCAGSRIGHKALVTAGEILALACTKVYENPAPLEAAKQEMQEVTGGTYHCPMDGVEFED